MRFCSSAAVLSLLAAGCVSSGPGAPRPGATPPTAQAQAETAEESMAAEETAALRALLERSLTDADLRRSLDLRTECRDDAGMRTMRLWGDGLGVWQEKRQFQLTADEVTAALERLRAADFAAFAPLYGGPRQQDPREHHPPPDEGVAILINCRIRVSLDGHSKESVQRAKGEQSAQLKALAEGLLALGEAAAKDGVEAASLREGLEKVGNGTLDPRVLQILLHRKPDAGENGEGFLMRLEGREVTTRRYEPAGGYGPETAVVIDASALRQLALALADLDPATMPVNLWAPVYTEVAVEVLDHRKSIQARRFAGLEPTAHGELQTSFDSLVQTLVRLQDQVATEGTAPAG